MKTLKKALAVLLSVIMIIGMVPLSVLPVTAAEIDEGVPSVPSDISFKEKYTYDIYIQTVDDADLWNSAYFSIGDGSNDAVKWDIQSNIDDPGDIFSKTYTSDILFPVMKLEVDFGMVLPRNWTGNVNIKINGYTVCSKAFTIHSNDYNKDIYIYPEPPRIEKLKLYTKDPYNNTYPVSLTSDLRLMQKGDETGNTLSGNIYVLALNQYNVPFDNWIKSVNHSGAIASGKDVWLSAISPDYSGMDKIEFSHQAGKYGVFKLTSTAGADHNVGLNLYCGNYSKWVKNGDPFNSFVDTSGIRRYTGTQQFNPGNVELKFRRGLNVYLNADLYKSFRGNVGDSIAVFFKEDDIPEGYYLNSVTSTGAGELRHHGYYGEYFYTLGDGNAVITATTAPNNYTIEYNANASDATGEMESTAAIYDKDVQLRSCGFTRNGWGFVGWNTKADGSGTAITDMGYAKNLTSERDGTVTLYAQWGSATVDITLKYPQEMGIADKVIHVNRGGSIPVESDINTGDAEGHYHFVSADRSLDNIQQEGVINLTYEKTAHTYGEAFYTVAPTCTTDGVEAQLCTECGYEKSETVAAFHQDVVHVDSIPATCESDGVENATVCNACGEVLERGAVIPALGHNYNFKNITWDLTTESGTPEGYVYVVCKNDSDHICISEATVTEEDGGFLASAVLDDLPVSKFLEKGKDIFTVTASCNEGGTLTADHTVALPGETVNIEYTVDDGCYLNKLTVKQGDTDIALNDNSFIMPQGNVTINAVFGTIAPNQCGADAYWRYDEPTKTLTVFGSGPMFDFTAEEADERLNNGLQYYAYKDECEYIVIDEGITYIGDFAFMGLSKVTDVQMSDSVTSVGRCAFLNDISVNNIRMSEALTSIDNNAFAYIGTIDYIDIPASVTSISGGAFYGTQPTEIYSFADPDSLTWSNTADELLPSKQTVVHVYSQYLSRYQEKFGSSVNATFVGDLDSKIHDITVVQSAHGTVTADCETVHTGTLVRLTNTADSGYGLKKYAVRDTKKNNIPVTDGAFVMPDRDVIVTAEFSRIYSINYEVASGEGTIEVPNNAPVGTTVTVTVNPYTNNDLKRLYYTDSNGEVTEITDNRFVMPASDITVTAEFGPIDYNVTYSDAQNGSVTGVATAHLGDLIELNVTPDEAYKLNSLTVTDSEGNEVNVTDDYKFNMPASDVTVSAEFVRDYYRITYSDTQNGTLSGVLTAHEGETVTLTVTSDDYYEAKSVFFTDSNGDEFSITDDRFVMPASDITVNAAFEKIDYDIDYIEAENGSVTGASTANYGDEVELTVTPEIGYKLETLSVRDADENEIQVTDGRFVMPGSDVSISSSFAIADYNINYVTERCVVSGPECANYGDEITLTITPDENCVIDKVTVMDADNNVIPVNADKFIMPASDVTVTVDALPITAYAEYDYETQILYFRYGPYRETSDSWEIKDDSIKPWKYIRYISKAVFDPSFAQARPKNTRSWFAAYDSLTDIEGIEYLNTSEVTDMNSMFYGYTGASLDVSGFDTSKVTDFEDMFYGCKNLTSLDISGFDTSSAESLKNMFYNCENLISIDVSGFNTSKVTDMGGMFASCSGLTSIDVSNFDTSSLKNISTMFAGCTQLKTIDLRNFNVPKYNNAVLVFRDCVNLETIYVATADTAWKANSGWDVFYNCEKLVGGTGTTFDSENIDISMAKVQDGYFTAKPFDITVVNASGGAVEADKSQAYMGDTVSLDFTSDDNMVFSHYTVTDKNGDKVKVNGDTFTMPASDVTVTAVFREQGIYDINEDGVEDINDIAFIISACVGEVEMTASQSAKADLNGDGAVDAFDAAELDGILFANGSDKGDVDLDGDIDLVDYAMVKAHISGVYSDENHPANLLDKSYLTAEYDSIKDSYDDGVIITPVYYNADINKDKAVDAFDLFYLDKIINAAS